ncbi:MAG: hypothetical protein ACRD04_07495 [Terriglobales bacterium]
MIEDSKLEIKVADAAWIAAATLHRERPDQQDFSIQEICARAEQLGFTRPGVRQHIQQHAVANRRPDPGRYRMLYETVPGRRRLYREGDPYDQRREESKTVPRSEDLTAAWQDLLPWYAAWSRSQHPQPDPLLELYASGRDIWSDEHADAYIERLRREQA